jgi:hypothetical protein
METETPTSRRRTYQWHPWEKWFSQKKFTLIRGKDFACQPHGMAQAIRNAAASDRFRLSISLTIDGDQVLVSVVGPAKPKKRKKPCPLPAKFLKQSPR